MTVTDQPEALGTPPHRASNVAWKIGQYVLAGLAGWAVFPIETIVLYVGLLIVALVGGLDTGSPVAVFFMVAAAVVLGALATAFLLVPAVAVSQWARRWVGAGLSHALPVLLVAVAAGIVAMVWIWGFGNGSVVDLLIAWGALFALMLPPLLTVMAMLAACGSRAPSDDAPSPRMRAWVSAS